MFEGLCVVATLGSCFLFLCAISEAIDLSERKSQERRETMRKAAYAVKHGEWQKKQNRRELWNKYTGGESI